MKKVFSTIIALGVASLAIVSCNKIESEESVVTKDTVILNVTAGSDDSKTAIVDPGNGSYQLKWTADDQLAVFEVADGTVQNKQSSAKLGSDGTEKTFTFTLSALSAASYDYTFVYPASSLSKSTGDNPIYRLSIPSAQTFEANSFDKDADLLVSEHKTTTTQPTDLTLRFARVGATARMVLKGLSTEEIIKQIKFSTTEGNIAGYTKFNPSTGVIDGNDEGVYSGQKEIVLTPAASDLTLSGEVVVWFRLYDITLTDNFTVFVKTGVAEYTKSINLSAGRTLEFQDGGLTKFEIDLSSNTDRVDVLSGTTYNLVSSMDDFVEGAKYILVGRYETNKMSYARFDALGAEAGSGTSAYRASVTLIAEADEVAKGSIPATILVPDSKAVYPVEIDKVETVNNNNYYSLKDVYSGSSTEGKYFKANSGNYLPSNGNNTDDAAKWTISFASSVPTITNVEQSTRFIAPNISSNRFAAYANAQSGNTLLLYIDPSSAVPTLATPTIEAGSTGNTITVLWDDVANADSYLVTCTGESDLSVNPGVEEASFSNLADGSYTITVTAISNNQAAYHNSNPASETVIVGTPSLGQPVIKSFKQTSMTAFSAEINAAVENATSYDWALFAGSTSGSSIASGNTTTLAFTGNYNSFAVGTTYYLIVTAKAEGYTSTDSEEAHFSAKNITDYSTVYTTSSDVTLSSDATPSVVISETSYPAVKTNKGSAASISVPSGTTTVYLFIAAWNGESQTVSVTNGTMDDTNITADTGISGSGSSYTLAGTASNYFRTITVDQNATVITITAATNKRFVLWGVNIPDDRADAGMSWSADSATASWDTGNTFSGFNAPTLTVGNASGITYESTNTAVATINSFGTVTIVGPGETTIKAKFAGDATYKPHTASYTLTVTDNRATVATPSFDPVAGEVNSNTAVSFQCETSDVTFYYTTDGNNPTTSSSTGNSVTISAACTVKVMATKAGYKDSAVATAAYTIAGVVTPGTEENPYSASEAAAAATATEVPDVYVKGIVSAITTAYNSQYGNVSFTISDDGLTSSTQFTAYRTTVASADDVAEGDCVILKGTLQLYTNNNTSKPELLAGNTIQSRLSMPTFASGDENFTTSTSVTLSAASGATIYYTSDGTTPDTNSSTYSSAIPVSSTTTIKAIAEKDGLVTGVASKTFTKVQTYAVTWSAPSNGTMTVKQGETTISSNTQVPQGATINITVSPADGYTLSTLVYNDGSDHDIKSAKSFTMPAHAVSITATFEQSSGGGTTDYSMTPDQSSTGSTSTSYITTLTEFTYDSIKWKMNQWNPKTLQIKCNQPSAASEFRFYNTTAFPGRITKVVITFSALTVSDASKLMFLGGSSEVSSTSGGTAGTWNSTSKTLTWTPGASDNFTFFAFYQNGKAASGTNYLAASDAIVVTYEN